MAMRTKKERAKFEQPRVDYIAARRSWFIHAGVAYSVISAPASVFRDAVLARSPQWRKSAEYMDVLQQDELDYATRWWLLNCLEEKHRGLRLYNSRETAESACTEQMVAG